MDPFDKNLLGLYLQNLENEKDVLSFCLVNKKFNAVCQNDNFFKLFLEKKYGKGIAEYKLPNETWKRYLLRLSFYKGLLEEEFNYKPEYENFENLDFEKKYFINQYDTSDINIAFIRACRDGDVNVVKFLLKDSRVNPNHLDQTGGLKYAARYGHIGVVKLLLKDKRIDPAKDHSIALRYAAENDHNDIVNLLLEDGRSDVEYLA